MSKLTKDQRYYQKQKKINSVDTINTDPESSTSGAKVSRRSICVRVSLDASQRLSELARKASLTRCSMLSRILLKSLPKYSSNPSSQNKLKRHDWRYAPKALEDLSIKYKGATGEVQLNLKVSSTAWYKLDFHKIATGFSKARIVKRLILEYKQVSEDLNKKRMEKAKESREQWDHFNVASYKGNSSSMKRSKFKNEGGVIKHVKGIPVENWDESELDEYLAIQDKIIRDRENL